MKRGHRGAVSKQKWRVLNVYVPPHKQHEFGIVVKYFFLFTSFSSWKPVTSRSPHRASGNLLRASCRDNREIHPRCPACCRALWWLERVVMGNDVALPFCSCAGRAAGAGSKIWQFWKPALKRLDENIARLKAECTDGLLFPKPLLCFTLLSRFWRTAIHIN